MRSDPVSDEVAHALADRRPWSRSRRRSSPTAFRPARASRSGSRASGASRRGRRARHDRRPRRPAASACPRRSSAASRDARKVGPRDLAAAIVQGAVGATTVGGTLAACRAAGIGFMGTGGLGGVHRGFPDRRTSPADLGELVRTEALIVSSGVKSILDARRPPSSWRPRRACARLPHRRPAAF